MSDKLTVKVDFPMFHSMVIIFIGGEYQPKSRIELFGFDGQGYMARTNSTNIDGKMFVYIHSKTFAMSVIAHEAIHAVSMILGKIGAKADFNNDEVQAYMVQYICEKVEDAIHAN